MPSASRNVALLRGINVGGHAPLPMAELRARCEAIGWTAVRTHLQSGNVVFEAEGPAARLEEALERELAERLGLAIPVIVRPAARWAAYVAGNPFREAAEREPNLVMLALARSSPAPDAERRLAERAAAGERIRQVEDAIWIHFARVAGSRLAPGLLDRVVGSPVTTRNWRTVLALDRLLAEE